MVLRGDQALIMSQASAESETGPIDCPTGECGVWLGVIAHYDDLWNTPITNQRVRIEVGGNLVADGPRTRGMPPSGKEEDEQEGEKIPVDLGSYRHGGITMGAAVGRVIVKLKPETTAPTDDAIEQKKQAIYAALSSFESSAYEWFQPWTKKWSEQGWALIPIARLHGRYRGVMEWWKSELDFWRDVKGWIKAGAHSVAQWYDSIPWYGKPFAGLLALIELEKKYLETIDYVAQKIWNGLVELWEGAKTLWEHRNALGSMVTALMSGSADEIEKAAEEMAKIPGKVGEVFGLIKTAAKEGSEGMKGLLELLKKTDVVQRTFKTVMNILAMPTPNFWEEALGVVEGYVLPEVLIAVILVVLAPLTEGASGVALATRIGEILPKLRSALGALKKVGEVFAKFFSKLAEIAEAVADLARSLIPKIEEVARGTLNALTKLKRGVGAPFGNLSRANELGVRSYKDLRKALKGTGLHAHHLIEKRFARVMGQNAEAMTAIAVTEAEHRMFTQAWRSAIPYGAGTANATQESVFNAAREIYRDYPAILQALGL